MSNIQIASPTVIRSLAELRSEAMDRNEAIDLVSSDVTWQDGNQLASRSWSRQEAALGDAIMADVPSDLADVLSVLLVAHERIEEDLIMGEGAPTAGPAGRVSEQIWIAIANCISVIASSVPAPTKYELTEISRVEKLQQLWIPGLVEHVRQDQAA